MSLPPFETLPAWVMGVSLAANFGAGVGLGVLHFGGLWRATRLLTGQGHAVAAVGWMVGRWAVLGGGLALASLEGAPPLLAMALGVLVARAGIVRRIRGSLP